MALLRRAALPLAAVGMASLARPARVPGQAGDDPWRPRTVPLFGASYSPGFGLLIGAGIAHTRYGFHALPPSTRLLAGAQYATAAQTYRVDLTGEFRQPLFPTILNVTLRASGLEIIRFHGMGNETDVSQPDSVYRVRQEQFLVAPIATAVLMPRLRLALGPLLKYARTRADSGILLTRTGPHYGAAGFGALGVRVALELDTRDVPAAAGRGAHLRLAGQWHPAAWDAIRPFASLAAQASTYLSAGDPPAATLALRAGGARVTGTAPFHELVYVGGETTVRGYVEQRFAGRSGAYANAELRLLARRVSIGDLGLFGLADAGRVWAPGESSDRWHAAAGGGLWFAWRHRRAQTVSIAAARSPERSAVYLRLGFLF
ncbi:MAG TPA: BamA/TamA family outer membrane protein [Gemmatimonadales bacterium]|nr:BamA/TamA family outer membrane protein [Gemmatimonadales bacterium]